MKYLLIGLLVLTGCSTTSTKTAIEAIPKIENNQDTIFKNQQEAIEILLYQKLCLQLGGDPNDVIKQTFDNWQIVVKHQEQWERARAMRMVTTDAKVYETQSVFDLIWKEITGKVDNAQ